MGKTASVGRVRRSPGPLIVLAVVSTLYATRLWGHLATHHHAASAAGAAQREETGDPPHGPTYPEWAPDADAGTQYLQFLVCMGLCNQVCCQLGRFFAGAGSIPAAGTPLLLLSRLRHLWTAWPSLTCST